MGIVSALMFIGYLSSVLSEYLYMGIIQAYFHQLRISYVQNQYQATTSATVSEMQNRLTNDLQMLSDTLLMPALSTFTEGITLIMSLVALFTFHWPLVLTVLLLSAIMLVMPVLFSQKLQAVTYAVSQSNNHYLDSIAKWLGGLSELKRYSARTKLISTLATSSTELETSKMQRAATVSVLNFVNLFTNIFSQFAIYIVAGILIQRGLIAFGVIISAGQFGGTVFNGIVSVSNSIGSIVSAKTLNAQVQASLDAQPAPPSYDDSHDFESLTIDNLALTYPNGESITFPDLTINRGEKILLTGDSGTGKSTLLKLITGEITASQGNVNFLNPDGQNMTLSPTEIGYLPQKSIVFPDTLENNMTMFQDALAADVPQVTTEVAIANDIQKFPQGTDTLINLDTPNLSGGQQQKLVLARALIHHKSILLIDEGTSAIDHHGTLSILQHLLSQDTTVIFVAHNLDAHTAELFDRRINLTAPVDA